MIIETALVELAKAGGTELFLSSSESLLKKVKTAKDIKQLFINTGEFFVDYENDADQLFDDMANVLSKENMTKLANELKDEPGYKLKDRLLNSLMVIMKEYEIPHGMALSYANAILFAIMGQLPVVAPDKYDRAYQAEWKAEQEESFKELAEKFERLRNELQIYQSRHLEILSADAIDLDIRRQTTDPKIGFDFFNVDDDTFKEALESKKNDEVIAIKARCKEEAIYCTINELWMQGENRPIFIVKNEEDWKSLLQIKDAGNIYIPWFYSDQIVAIPNNTNIFVFTERVPSFIKGEINLRPRTYSTISASLQRAGMGINEANKLVSETHGLFIPLKKKLFNGAYLKEPRWLNGLHRNIKETALLIGQWTDCDGDKAVIESLSGIKYQDFISEIKEYARDEDPFIHIVDINSTKEYYLASAENAWDYIDVDNDSEIWNKFKDVLLEVINEAEKLFTYSSQEKLVAQFKGEKFFWSAVIRKGMLRSLIMKASYLGRVLSDYWADDFFDKNVFASLYKCQSKHEMAIEYIEGLARRGVDVYTNVNELSECVELDDDFRIILFRIEALYTDKKPLVDNASVEIKRAFWKDFRWFSSNNMDWAVAECQQYGTVNTYLDLLYRFHENRNLTPEQLLEKMQRIDVMERGSNNSMTDHYLKELLKPLQEQCIEDRDKCAKIAHIEIAFFYLLDWEDMKCFQKEIKHDPEMYAEMVSVIFRHDGDDPEERKTEEFRNYAKVIHRLFDMAKFCPCEENGTVSYDEIRVWVDKLIRILDSNHQKEMFGYVLGRLFAYAPKAADGHYPCEAVCQIIEEYGDESLLSEYRCELFNKRGIFSPSAGRAEKDIAEDYKDNADFLSIKYPKTADVFFKMSQRYIYDSDLERRRAENGYF